jgi:hypothetical protein
VYVVALTDIPEPDVASSIVHIFTRSSRVIMHNLREGFAKLANEYFNDDDAELRAQQKADLRLLFTKAYLLDLQLMQEFKEEDDGVNQPLASLVKHASRMKLATVLRKLADMDELPESLDMTRPDDKELLTLMAFRSSLMLLEAYPCVMAEGIDEADVLVGCATRAVAPTGHVLALQRLIGCSRERAHFAAINNGAAQVCFDGYAPSKPPSFALTCP